MRRLSLIVLCATLLPAAAAWSANKQQQRLVTASNVFQQIMDTPDKGIPRDLVARSVCIGIFPSVKKVAFVFGGSHGAGFVLCRKNDGKGPWGPPSGFSISGGSFGFQLGASATDFVLLFMNKDGMEKLLQNKFTLGADASVAGGPVGRTAAAATDAQMTAKVLSYSRSKGLFAGVSLKGAVLRPSSADNKALYGRKVSAKDLLLNSKHAAPASAGRLIRVLDKYSSRRSKTPL